MCVRSSTFGTFGGSCGSRVYLYMIRIVFLMQFCVLTNLTLIGIAADVSSCVSVPKPHGVGLGNLLDPEAAGRKRQPVM